MLTLAQNKIGGRAIIVIHLADPLPPPSATATAGASETNTRDGAFFNMNGFEARSLVIAGSKIWYSSPGYSLLGSGMIIKEDIEISTSAFLRPRSTTDGGQDLPSSASQKDPSALIEAASAMVSFDELTARDVKFLQDKIEGYTAFERPMLRRLAIATAPARDDLERTPKPVAFAQVFSATARLIKPFCLKVAALSNVIVRCPGGRIGFLRAMDRSSYPRAKSGQLLLAAY